MAATGSSSLKDGASAAASPAWATTATKRAWGVARPLYMTEATRIRILLAVLAAAAIGWVIVWPVTEPAERLSNAPPYAPPPSPQAAFQATAEQATGERATGEDEGLSPTLSDAEYAEKLNGYGLLVMLRDPFDDGSRGDTGSFYFVTLDDSARALGDLGFIRGRALLDSGSRFQSIGDSGATARFEVASRQVVDSQLRQRDDCILGASTPLRRVSAGDARWLVALADGGGERLAPRVWRDGRAADPSATAEALRLAVGSPFDDSLTRERAETFRESVALTLTTHRRFTIDGTEIIVADARREAERRYVSGGDSAVETIEEQRSFIAERGADGRFRIVWYHHGSGTGDDITLQTPVMALRLGRERLLTIYTSDRYVEGLGGSFISRVGAGSWRPVASWSGGC